MNYPRHRFLILAAFVSLLLYVALSLNQYVFSQCTTIDVPAQQWKEDQTIYYNFGNITDSIERQQIETAITKWNDANQTNNSRIKFSSAAPPSGARTLTFQNGTNTTSAGNMSPIINLQTKEIVSATITFDLSKRNSSNVPWINPNGAGYSDIFTKIAIHEIGHTMGLNEAPIPDGGICAQADGATVMNGMCGSNDTGNNLPLSVPQCDQDTLKTSYPPPVPSPTATPTPEPDPCASEVQGSGLVISNALCSGDGGDLAESGSAECNDGIDNDQDGMIDCDDPSCPRCPSGCSNYQQELCFAVGAMGCWQGMCYTPILIDVNGDGYKMTNAANGVSFKVLPNLRLTRLSWTAENSDDAWLVLDRNGNGTIDSGEEQFGNATPQPWSMEKNGFKALAQYDSIFYGGNEDGVIDGRDAVFARLQLWCDRNHNGISEPDELSDLPSAGLFGIELKYKEWKKVDEFGNAFRYRAKLLDGSGHSLGKWAFDVFLKTY